MRRDRRRSPRTPWASSARDNQGYTPLDQIGPDNVAGLRLASALAMPEGTNQTAPLVHDGVMLLASPGNVVQALDAATGELLWEHRHQYPEDGARELPAGHSRRRCRRRGGCLPQPVRRPQLAGVGLQPRGEGDHLSAAPGVHDADRPSRRAGGGGRRSRGPGGKQYVAVPTGVGIFRGLSGVLSPDIYQPPSGNGLYVFALPDQESAP